MPAAIVNVELTTWSAKGSSCDATAAVTPEIVVSNELSTSIKDSTLTISNVDKTNAESQSAKLLERTHTITVNFKYNQQL